MESPRPLSARRVATWMLALFALAAGVLVFSWSAEARFVEAAKKRSAAARFEAIAQAAPALSPATLVDQVQEWGVADAGLRDGEADAERRAAGQALLNRAVELMRQKAYLRDAERVAVAAVALALAERGELAAGPGPRELAATLLQESAPGALAAADSIEVSLPRTVPGSNAIREHFGYNFKHLASPVARRVTALRRAAEPVEEGAARRPDPLKELGGLLPGAAIALEGEGGRSLRLSGDLAVETVRVALSEPEARAALDLLGVRVILLAGPGRLVALDPKSLDVLFEQPTS